MKIEEINDYAMPLMMAERAIKDAYDMIIHQDSDGAIAKCRESIQEITKAIEAITHEKIKTSSHKKHFAQV